MNESIKSILSDEIISKIETAEQQNKDNPEAIYSLYIHIVPKEISGYDWDKYYVGITKQDLTKRWGTNGHGYYGQPFWNAINKYGWNNLKHVVVSNLCTELNACELEQDIITYLKSTNQKYGYNVHAGGFGGSSDNLNSGIYEDLTEKRFGMLTVTKRVEDKIRNSGRKIPMWECVCDCGNTIICSREVLMRKNKTDCGCQRSNKMKDYYLQRYLSNKKIEIIDDYIIYYFPNHQLIFDLEDYDKIKDLYFYYNSKKDTYYYNSVFNNTNRYLVHRLFFKYSSYTYEYLNGNNNDYRKNNLLYKEKHPKTRKQSVVKQEQKKLTFPSKWIPVLQFSTSGELIAKYKSVTEAANTTGYNKSNISGCCKGRNKTYKGFLWKYENEYIGMETKCIVQYDLNAIEVNRYKTIDDALASSGVEIPKIYHALTRNKHFGGGYLWAYINDNVAPYRRNKPVNKKTTNKPVVQYDIDGNIINIYDSLTSAANIFNKTSSNIFNCCKNKTQTAYGYKWKYLKDVNELEITNSFLLQKYYELINKEVFE